MNTLIFSTNKAPWGGSESLWKRLCLEGKDLGLNVLASYIDHPLKKEHIHELGQRDVLLQPRSSTSNTDWQTLKDNIRGNRRKRQTIDPQGSVWKNIKDFNPGRAIFNLGYAFEWDFFWHQKAIDKHLRGKIPYRIIVHFNTNRFPFMREEDRQKFRWIYEGAERVFFVSEDNARSTARQLGIRELNYELVSGQVTQDNNLDVHTGKSKNLLRLAIVARLNHDVKGQDIAFDFISSYAKKEKIQLNIYGTGDSEEHLERLRNFYGLEDQVTFHGFVPSKEQIWQENDALFLTSADEGLPLSVLEALTFNKGFICTPAGGMDNVDPEFGFSVDLSDREGFFEMLDNLYDDRSSLIHRATKGHAHYFGRKHGSFAKQLLL